MQVNDTRIAARVSLELRKKIRMSSAERDISMNDEIASLIEEGYAAREAQEHAQA